MQAAARRTASWCWAAPSHPSCRANTASRWSMAMEADRRDGKACARLSVCPYCLLRWRCKPGGRSAPRSDFVYPLLDNFGIPRARVMLETRSRNTAENAAYAKELINPKPGERWLLVTSARTCPAPSGVSVKPDLLSKLTRSGGVPGARLAQYGVDRSQTDWPASIPAPMNGSA